MTACSSATRQQQVQRATAAAARRGVPPWPPLLLPCRRRCLWIRCRPRWPRACCTRAAPPPALASAAATETAAATRIELWVQQATGASLAAHAGSALSGLLALMRELLPQWVPSQQQPLPGPEQRYASWFGGTLLAPQHQAHLQFLVQQVLVPMLPEDGPCWVQAQADALASLLRRARQQHAPLPPSAQQAAEEYLGMAQQRLKAAAQEREEEQRGGGDGGAGAAPGRAGGQGGGGSPGTADSNLHKGREIVKGLLKVGVGQGPGLAWHHPSACTTIGPSAVCV